jgi:hypothetical protein
MVKAATPNGIAWYAGGADSRAKQSISMPSIDFGAKQSISVQRKGRVPPPIRPKRRVVWPSTFCTE